MQQLRNTPFHERTSALCQPQNWRKWAGYFVVGSYEHTIDREYWAIRNSAALIDVTPLMKYIIKGKDAALAVQEALVHCKEIKANYSPRLPNGSCRQLNQLKL